MSFTKLIFVPVVIISFCIVLLYSAYHDVRQETVNQLNIEQMTHAHQAETGIRLFFNDYNLLLKFMARQSSVIDMTQSGKDLINIIYQGHTPEIRAITRVDETGKIIHTVPYNPKYIGIDIRHQEHIKKILSTHQEVLSDVFDAVQGFRSIAYYVPVFKNGVFKGGLAILIPFETLSKNYLSNIKIRQSGAAWTISQNGVVIYSPYSKYNNKNAFDLFEKSPSILSMLKKAANGETGSGLYTWHDPNGKSSDDEEVFVSYYPVKVADRFWAIIVTAPEGEVISTMRVFMNKWVIIVLLLILGSSAYLYYIIKARAVLKEEIKRKKAEEALRQSEQKFKTLFQTAGDAIFLLELNGRIIEVNNYAIQKFGYTREEFLKLTTVELNFPKNTELVASRMQQLTKAGELYFESVYQTKEGARIPVGISIRLVEYEDRKVALSIARDISIKKKEEEELIHAKEEAEKASKLKSEFLAQMSHEIRSPLNVVVGFTQLLREELREHLTDDMITSFKGIDAAGKRIIRTVELILNMSELQTGTYELFRSDFDLVKDLLENIFNEYEIAARKKGLQISIISNNSDTMINADYFSTSQIFANLIDNAIKYTHLGSVEIKVDKDANGTLTVMISDTGIGISDEYLPKLFEPFTQEEQGYSRKYEGTGLGMALVKRYCQINNINITVETKKAIGTRYILQFPNNS
ncbi:MAG: ATP-binding protein [Melioribacteraceae bacterium]